MPRFDQNVSGYAERGSWHLPNSRIRKARTYHHNPKRKAFGRTSLTPAIRAHMIIL